MGWLIAVLSILVIIVAIVLLKTKKAKPLENGIVSNQFNYTDVPLFNGSFDAVGEPEDFKITIFTQNNHKVSFDVKTGQITSYAFRSENGNKVGNYEVG